MIKSKPYFIFSLVFSGLICWFAWDPISALKPTAVQPISSVVATVSGILLGCVIGAVTLLISSDTNRLIRNMRLTGGLQKLIFNLNQTMLFLIATCAIFLAVLFIPKELTMFCVKAYSAVMVLGVYTTAMSFLLFLYSWNKFKQVATNM